MQSPKGNQYVWVEVPRTTTVYPTAGLAITSFTDDEYRKIENDLKTYTTVYRNNTEYTDDNFQPATGLTDAQYNTQKKKMLKSIYKNGGFYVGRYETGIDYREGARTEAGNTTQTPVIKQNAYPYNFVTTSQAQALASSLVTNGVTSSLMFGVQWDLILKYIETKGLTQAELNSNSTNWGNFKTNTYNITNSNSKYTTDAASWVDGAYGQKNSSKNIILTTGASETFKKQNIYDLAGNVGEKTLEKTDDLNRPASGRGGWWMDEGTHGNQASSRTKSLSTHANRSFGFRVSLYRDEGI